MSKRSIFISYRRSDGLTMTGRIHDRLADSYGSNSIFMDMEDIPGGADFRKVLEQAISKSQVVLVIIGQKWLTMADESGTRRIDHPNDFVRLEVEQALRTADTLVIPVLIDGAVMPDSNSLPDGLKELPFRNAVVIRNDPDFRRDMETLNAQINHQFGPRNQMSRSLLMGGMSVIIALLVFFTAFFISRTQSGAPTSESSLTAAPSTAAEIIPTVFPAAPDEDQVVVANIESSDPATSSDISETIISDLQTRLVTNVSYSKIHIAGYKGIVKSDAQAQEAAKASQAGVIIWGRSTPQGIVLNIQIGALDKYPNLLVTRSVLERSMNVQARLTDEHTQSVANPVLAMLYTFKAAIGDIFEASRVLVLARTVREQAPIINSTVAANIHRSFQAVFFKPSDALTAINAAIDDDPANPLLYGFRSLIYTQKGDLTAARADANSMDTVDSKVRLLAKYLRFEIDWLENKFDSAISNLSEVIKIAPNDWYAVYLRGAAYYMNGNVDLAERDTQTAIDMHPPANFPYMFALLFAARNGEFQKLTDVYTFIQKNFPDYTIGVVYIDLIMGNSAREDFRIAFKGFGLLFLRRHDDLIAESSKVLDHLSTFSFKNNNYLISMLYFLRGFSYCNIDNDAKAEEDYSEALTYDPDNVLVYVLRADARSRLNNMMGALSDLQAAQSKMKNKDDLKTMMQSSTSGTLTCKDGFVLAPDSTPAATEGTVAP